MIIKQLKPADVTSIMRVDLKAFGHKWDDEEVFLDRITVFPEGCLGIFEDDNLVAFITSEIWSDYHKPEYNRKASKHHDVNGKILYVTDMAVLPNYQGKGIGSKLVDLLKQLAKENCLDLIYLGTSKARKFYERNGFRFLKHVIDDYPYDLMEFKIK